jgi:hypothetical protein
MQDLSHLAAGSLAVSAMSGGNTVSTNAAALTAPGSPPVDVMPESAAHADPGLTFTAKHRTVLTAGAGYAPSPAVWKETSDG